MKKRIIWQQKLARLKEGDHEELSIQIKWTYKATTKVRLKEKILDKESNKITNQLDVTLKEIEIKEKSSEAVKT